MARLTAKAFAELLDRPAFDQMRILREQRFPRREPAFFRTSYYQPAIDGILRFYRDENDPGALEWARRQADQVNPGHRTEHNHRVLDAFEVSPAYTRMLTIRNDPKYRREEDHVTVRLAPDLVVREDGVPKIIFLNCRAEGLEEDFARRIIEVAHWVLEGAGVDLPIGQMEVVDLSSGITHTTRRRRRRTINRLEDNIAVIQALWDSLE